MLLKEIGLTYTKAFYHEQIALKQQAKTQAQNLITL